MLAEIALSAMRRAERTVGPAAALAIARPALETVRGPARRTILLAALGTAIRGVDHVAFAELTRAWARSGTEEDPRALSLVARLVDVAQLDLAARLATAELERRRSAMALLSVAVLTAERTLLVEAAERARGDEVDRVVRARLALGTIEDADAAADLVARDERDALALAPTALMARGLYARVRTLDRLVALTSSESTRLSATRIAFAHADLRGASLSAIERDRVGVIAASVREERSGPSTDDARAALAGTSPAHDPADGATLALRALATAVRDDPSSEPVFAALAAHAATPVGWTAVMTALSRRRTAGAAACVERWLDDDVAPPRGFTMLAALLAQAGQTALAERTMLLAARANETGARAHVGGVLAHRARLAYDAGDLGTAETLLRRALAIDPDG
jgi:hypothetical protein